MGQQAHAPVAWRMGFKKKKLAQCGCRVCHSTVSRKTKKLTIPRGAEIIYSHIVFDKYGIDPETK
jgi:hypothetical protein